MSKSGWNHFHVAFAAIIVAINCGVFMLLHRQLRTGKWIFMFYFDDQKNFVDSFSELSFSPLSVHQIMKVLSHVGLNVFEPAGNLTRDYYYYLDII